MQLAILSVLVMELNMAGDTKPKIVFEFTAKSAAVPKSIVLTVWS